jgi:hypothetical protein
VFLPIVKSSTVKIPKFSILCKSRGFILLFLQVELPLGRCLSPQRWHEPSRRAKPVRRHIIVNALVLACRDELSLVPDPHIAIVSKCLIEGCPGWKMRVVLMGRIMVKLSKAAPISHDHNIAQAEMDPRVKKAELANIRGMATATGPIYAASKAY